MSGEAAPLQPFKFHGEVYWAVDLADAVYQWMFVHGVADKDEEKARNDAKVIAFRMLLARGNK